MLVQSRDIPREPQNIPSVLEYRRQGEGWHADNRYHSCRISYVAKGNIILLIAIAMMDVSCYADDAMKRLLLLRIFNRKQDYIHGHIMRHA
jgi:hypothetical protein